VQFIECFSTLLSELPLWALESSLQLDGGNGQELLQARVAELETRRQLADGLADEAQVVTDALRLAEDAAALLQAAWALPGARPKAAEQLSMVAAARSCAYLRCATVELEGGPSAGQGRRCKRCSKCRVFW
jgi:hypothetical protein